MVLYLDNPSNSLAKKCWRPFSGLYLLDLY